METMIKVSDLCKTYIVEKRQNNVLRNVNFEVKKGDMIAIMGPSGSGKSTLLYSVSGMDDATSGEILFDGKDITKLSSKELAKLRLDDMGFIFQQMYMMKNLFSLTFLHKRELFLPHHNLLYGEHLHPMEHYIFLLKQIMNVLHNYYLGYVITLKYQ